MKGKRMSYRKGRKGKAKIVTPLSKPNTGRSLKARG